MVKAADEYVFTLAAPKTKTIWGEHDLPNESKNLKVLGYFIHQLTGEQIKWNSWTYIMGFMYDKGYWVKHYYDDKKLMVRIAPVTIQGYLTQDQWDKFHFVTLPAYRQLLGRLEEKEQEHLREMSRIEARYDEYQCDY